ncbi:hypothetical protein BT63DRAFT_382517 [Microthyrium microscopicum]|uniref:Small ribosomal subunit protein mS23 n=1 Tax=Microthyrium microscopicum TaxID=703497 RepID=A0A6A6UMG0_9PEZI|nr:hypothetical protein BT63DRAFT_382517 [Microthyrium microscopicum]
MGKHDFRPVQVLRAANQLLETKAMRIPPPWHKIMHDVPPSESVVRPVKRFANLNSKRSRKSRRMFQPLEITYPEDKLRTTFFNDHPWELARPKVVLEDDGNDSKNWDWSRIEQPGKTLDGESVVRRQMWLIEHFVPGPGDEHLDSETISQRAYDQARKEFYQLRLREDVEREVAKEETVHLGTREDKLFAWNHIGESLNDRSLKAEDDAFEEWREWATTDMEEEAANRSSLYSGAGDEDPSISDDVAEIATEYQETEAASAAGGRNANKA